MILVMALDVVPSKEIPYLQYSLFGPQLITFRLRKTIFKLIWLEGRTFSGNYEDVFHIHVLGRFKIFHRFRSFLAKDSGCFLLGSIGDLPAELQGRGCRRDEFLLLQLGADEFQLF